MAWTGVDVAQQQFGRKLRGVEGSWGGGACMEERGTLGGPNEMTSGSRATRDNALVRTHVLILGCCQWVATSRLRVKSAERDCGWFLHVAKRKAVETAFHRSIVLGSCFDFFGSGCENTFNARTSGGRKEVGGEEKERRRDFWRTLQQQTNTPPQGRGGEVGAVPPLLLCVRTVNQQPKESTLISAALLLFLFYFTLSS